MVKKHLVFMVLCILISSNVGAASVRLPVYGNWCGVGYPAEGENPVPIDLVDKECRSHDIKYAQCEQEENRLMCEAEADLELVDSLRNDVDKLNRVQLIVANNIGKYFVVQGPVKAVTENTKQLLVGRYQAATGLTDGAKNALLKIGVKLNDIVDVFVAIKDIAVDQVNNMVSGDIKNDEPENSR